MHYYCHCIHPGSSQAPGPFNSPRLGSTETTRIVVTSAAANGEVGFAMTSDVVVTEPDGGSNQVCVVAVIVHCFCLFVRLLLWYCEVSSSWLIMGGRGYLVLCICRVIIKGSICQVIKPDVGHVSLKCSAHLSYYLPTVYESISATYTTKWPKI